MWTVGLVRDPSITFSTGPTTTEKRRSYFWTKFASVAEGVRPALLTRLFPHPPALLFKIDFFLNDFDAARRRADAFDEKITSAAKAVSTNYAHLVSLATRLVIGSTEVTVPTNLAARTWNDSDIMTFVKDNGRSRRSSPTGGIYSAFPAFLSLNASWGAYLLEPLLRYQRDVSTSKLYALPDLGGNFPDIVPSSSVSVPESGGLEDSSTMIILVYAHARYSGDGGLIARYVRLFFWQVVASF